MLVIIIFPPRWLDPSDPSDFKASVVEPPILQLIKSGLRLLPLNRDLEPDGRKPSPHCLVT